LSGTDKISRGKHVLDETVHKPNAIAVVITKKFIISTNDIAACIRTRPAVITGHAE
jgi:hypothetical protein